LKSKTFLLIAGAAGGDLPARVECGLYGKGALV
jgi:hypothetical protein